LENARTKHRIMVILMGPLHFRKSSGVKLMYIHILNVDVMRMVCEMLW
jgi:hypothetical protein